MAMSFIEEAAVKIAHPRIIFAIAITALGLAACAQNPNQSEMRMSPDFGDALTPELRAKEERLRAQSGQLGKAGAKH